MNKQEEDRLINQGKEVLRTEAEAINELMDRVGPDFIKALEIIESCKGRVVVTGMGKSGLIGKKIAATFASTGTPSMFLHPAEGSHGDLGMIMRGDVVIALSSSGETSELTSILTILKLLDVKLIALTGNITSTLAKAADVVLNVAVKNEACPLGIVPTASTTATLAMGDALAVALHTKRGFKKEDFAFFHPGGSLGRRLLSKVQDFMHSGQAIPIVEVTTPMKDVIIEISSKRLGVATVVDSDLKLVGVITDGDLRRGFEKWGNGYFHMKAEEVMSKGPKTTTKDTMAVQALSTMEQFSITSVVVVSSENKVEGIIHLHDILKAGIVR